jgi:hypothetical protein
MPSRKRHRRLTAEASDRITWSDQAGESFQPGTDRTTRSPGNWCRFIALDGREQEFDVAGSWVRTWLSSRTDRAGQILHSFLDERGHDYRFVLAFVAQEGVPNRELTREEATYWLKIIGREIPSDLRHIATFTTDDYPRLRSDWLPSSRPVTPTEPSHWEVDPQIMETLRAVGHRLTTEKLLTEMTRRGLHPSNSTVKKRLAYLVKARRLTNDSKVRPRGYGLPAWNDSSGSLGS